MITTPTIDWWPFIGYTQPGNPDIPCVYNKEREREREREREKQEAQENTGL